MNIIALVLLLTGYRFDKYHRHNETWQYRYLKTTMSNIIANDWFSKLTGEFEQDRNLFFYLSILKNH